MSPLPRPSVGRPAAGLVALVVASALVAGPASAAPAEEVARGTTAFSFTDPRIGESSGLVELTSGDFVTVNDSGDSARVFVVDPVTGGTVGVRSWDADVTDVEALAPAREEAADGSAQVWVADSGGNVRARDEVRVWRVPVGRGDRTVEPTASYVLRYPDGARDTEVLLLDPREGRMFLVSKGIFGGQVYAAPARLSARGPNELTSVGTALPLATDGAFLPDGRHALVRNYDRVVAYETTGGSWTDIGSASLPRQQQGEGLSVGPRGDVHVSSEGVGASVLALRLPADLRRALAPARPSASAPPSATAGDDRVAAGSDQGALPWQGHDWWVWVVPGALGLAVLTTLVALVRHRPRRR